MIYVTKCEKDEVRRPIPDPSSSLTRSHEEAVEEEEGRAIKGISFCEGRGQGEEDEYCYSGVRLFIRPYQRVWQDAAHERPIPVSDETEGSSEICPVFCGEEAEG